MLHFQRSCVVCRNQYISTLKICVERIQKQQTGNVALWQRSFFGIIEKFRTLLLLFCFFEDNWSYNGLIQLQCVIIQSSKLHSPERCFFPHTIFIFAKLFLIISIQNKNVKKSFFSCSICFVFLLRCKIHDGPCIYGYHKK